MSRLLFLLAVLLVAGSATAQDPYAIRVVAEEGDLEGVSLGDLVRGLHVLAPGAEEIHPITLGSALVVDGELLETGRSRFIASPFEGEVGDDAVMGRVSGARVHGSIPPEYFEQRAETPLDGDLFTPAYLPGDPFDPELEVSSMVPARRLAVVERPDGGALIEAARAMDPEAFEAGEPFLIFFVADGETDATEVVGFLRKRPGR